MLAPARHAALRESISGSEFLTIFTVVIGKLYKSTIDADVWAPDAYPAGWEAM